MRGAAATALTAVVLVSSAASAAARSDALRATPAAAPFAQSWANVPRTAPGRKAAKIVVFGASEDVVGGFNTNLNCCDFNWNTWLGPVEALHGAFVQNAKGVWVKDLVRRASATKTSLSYTISPKAFWYWGGRKLPVTYRDFVYTLQQIDNPANDLAGRQGYNQLNPTKFTHRGDKHVTFFWKTTKCSTDFPCGAYANWQSLFSGLYPAQALAGLDFDKIWTNCICGRNGKPVADGPYYVSNYTPGQGVTLKANPFWAGKKPNLREIDFKVITSESVLTEAMRSGSVDAIAPSVGQDFVSLRGVPGISWDDVPNYEMEFLQFREGDAKAGPTVSKGASNLLLRAPWIREAIGLAIDRQAIMRTVLGRDARGLKPLESSLFYGTEASYKRDFARWDYNPAKAVAILKAHCKGGPSKPDRANHKVWQCAGLPARFRWTWTAEDTTRTETETLAKADLKAVGIAVTEHPLPLDKIFSRSGLPSGDFDIADFSLFTSGDPGDWYEVFRCGGQLNWTGYCSHAVETLLTAANGQLDPAKRASLYRRADSIMATQMPVMPLFQHPVPLIHKTNLLGLRLNPGQGGPVWNVEDWRWKR